MATCFVAFGTDNEYLNCPHSKMKVEQTLSLVVGEEHVHQAVLPLEHLKEKQNSKRFYPEKLSELKWAAIELCGSDQMQTSPLKL